MKRFLLGLFVFTFIFACHAEKKSVQDGKSIVPEQYLEVINKADSMTFIMIDPWSEATENWMDGYGEMLCSKTCGNKDFKAEWYNVLSNPKSFEASNLVKNCIFMPDFAIVFHAKKGDVTVAYSFYCDICRFAKKDKYVDLNGELVCKDFLNLMAKAFPKDRYVRYLIKKSKSNF